MKKIASLVLVAFLFSGCYEDVKRFDAWAQGKIKEFFFGKGYKNKKISRVKKGRVDGDKKTSKKWLKEFALKGQKEGFFPKKVFNYNRLVDVDVSNLGKQKIFVINKDWGIIKIDVSPRVVDRQWINEVEQEYYPYRYDAFLIFDEGIEKQDLRWEGNSIVNVKTKDILILKSRRYNLLFASAPRKDLKNYNHVKITKSLKEYIKEVQEKNEKINTSDKNKSSKVLPFEKQKSFYLAKRDDTLFVSRYQKGIEIMRLHDDGLERISTIPFVKSAGRIVLKGDVLFARGHKDDAKNLYIVDIKDLKKTKLLKVLNLDYYIESMVLADDDVLYVSARARKGVIYIYAYDMKDAKNPRLLKEVYTKDELSGSISYTPMVYVNGYLAHIKKRKGIRAYNHKDFINPDVNFMDIEYKDFSLDRYVSHIFVRKGRLYGLYGNERTLRSYELSKDEVKKFCDVEIYDKKPYNFSATYFNNPAIEDRGFLFLANREFGIAVIDPKKCKKLDSIKMKSKLTNKLIKIKNKIWEYDNNEMINLDEYWGKG